MWRPLPTGLAYAICVHPFYATQDNDLPLQLGDQIYIIEQGGRYNEWYRGYLLSPPSLLAGLTSDRGQQLEHRVFTGIFPQNCVEVRELVGEGARNEPSRTSRVGGTNQSFDEDGVEKNEHVKRKEQAEYARRLSRALSRKLSSRDLAKRSRRPLVDSSEPMPRDPNVPKPLAPVPLLRVGDEAGESAEEPLVDEIASCLREWHDARLHETLLARGYLQLARVQDLVCRLDMSRKQLMHDVMTAKELGKLREDTVWDLVSGNKLLKDDVIVRSPTEKGRILTAGDSVVEMTKLQANMSILDRPPEPPVDLHMLYHILVDVQNFVYDSDTLASLNMCLYAKEHGEKPRPITENYAIPVPFPDAAPQYPADFPKTLFTELSSADIGLGSNTTQVFVVFKLLKEEIIHHGTSAPAPSQAASGNANSLTPNSSTSQKTRNLRERRSLLGSQKKRDSQRRASAEISTRPSTVHSERSDMGSTSSLSTSGLQGLETRTAKRTIGIGAIELSRLARQQSEIETRVSLWAPCPPAEDQSGNSKDFLEVVRELAKFNASGFSRIGPIKRFEVSAAAFASADLDALVRNTPTLLHNVHHTEKLGFSGVPVKRRSDIYLTLTNPVLEHSPCLQHSKYGNVPVSQRCQSNLANLQLTLEVRKGNGERVEDCIYTAANHQAHTAWRTTAIERGEEWNQTIKLSLPASDVPGSHVVLSVADSPNFPFALGWIPLWESDAFVRDGDHQVALYVYDEYSSSMVGGKGAYLSLPPWHKREHEPSYGSSALVSIRTYLCSTEYSQDPNLLGLLGWRKYHGAKLVEVLERFSSVPGVEVVKLLGEVFTALFEILHEYANSESYEDLIFYDLVVVLSITRDRRFNLSDVVEKYAEKLHNWPQASRSLLRAYQRLVTNPLDPLTSRKLRETLKVGDQILKLIIETRRIDGLSNGLTNGVDHDEVDYFTQELQKLFVSVMALLRNPMPVLLGTQTLLVQNFHSWLPELHSLMSPTEIMEIATDLVDSFSHAHGRMIFHRLILILNYSYLDTFKGPEVRGTLIANTFRWLSPYWSITQEADEQWHGQVRLCCSIVAAQMRELGEESCQYVPKLVESYSALQKVERTPKRVFSMLFPASYPFPTKPTSHEINVDEAMLEISAVLSAALMSQQRLYFDANEIDIHGILMQVLRVVQSILNGEAFPKTWLSLLVGHHRYAMTALERISEVLIESIPDSFAPDAEEAIEFDTQIWRVFFETLFSAVGSPALSMESFPEQKRRAVWKIAGDVRELGADLIRRTWNAIGWETDLDSKELHGFERLGGYQVQFVPDLVPSIVELCLSVHASLRAVAIEVLRTMIISTWEIDQDLNMIQLAMIDCLDKLCRTRQATESMLQKTFIDEMVAQFSPLQNTVEDGLYVAVMAMFGKIEQLLGMLATVQHGSDVNEANKIVDTLQLMQFLKDVSSEDAYIRYVHQLADLQIASEHHTEAGLALQMHANRYAWDSSTTVAKITDPSFPAQTAFERKEALYFEMCKHFETGQSWQHALNAYKELANEYETNTFDFYKLARSQRAIAGIYEKIARGDRLSARYFRVVFKGLGFNVSVRDKEFIFEGLPSDRQASFEERMQRMYPTAQILRSPQETDVEGQFIYIYPVSPNKHLGHIIYQRTKVSQAAREYALVSNPQSFTSSVRQLQPEVPVTNQVVEKTVYTTEKPFPNILRRSEIVKIDTVTLSQIHAAVERTTRKTQELLYLEKRIASGKDEAGMTRMSEDLLLAVDPDSDSSVARYRKLLPSSEQSDAQSQELDFEDLGADHEHGMSTMQNALKVALLDHVLAIRRCLSLYTGHNYVAAKAELVPRFEASFSHELAILFPGKGGLMEELSRRSSVADRHLPGDSRNEGQPAASGAQADDSADEGQGRRGRRRSRRSSLSFLHRFSLSRSTDRADRDGAGGWESDTEGGAGQTESRGRSRRSRSRSRNGSISHRLSLVFSKNDSQIFEDGGRSGSMTNGTMTPTSDRFQMLNSGGRSSSNGPNNAIGNTLRKRLSFLKGVTGQPEGGGGP